MGSPPEEDGKMKGPPTPDYRWDDGSRRQGKAGAATMCYVVAVEALKAQYASFNMIFLARNGRKMGF